MKIKTIVDDNMCTMQSGDITMRCDIVSLSFTHFSYHKLEINFNLFWSMTTIYDEFNEIHRRLFTFTRIQWAMNILSNWIQMDSSTQSHFIDRSLCKYHIVSHRKLLVAMSGCHPAFASTAHTIIHSVRSSVYEHRCSLLYTKRASTQSYGINIMDV